MGRGGQQPPPTLAVKGRSDLAPGGQGSYSGGLQPLRGGAGAQPGNGSEVDSKSASAMVGGVESTDEWCGLPNATARTTGKTEALGARVAKPSPPRLECRRRAQLTHGVGGWGSVPWSPGKRPPPIGIWT